MPSKEQINTLIGLLRDNIGPIYSESNVDEFQLHVDKLVDSENTSDLGSRISLLFAYWSNIHSLAGDEVVVSSEDVAEYTLLKEYKFSIATELALLCPILLEEDVGQPLKIQTQEQFELFKEILKQVDGHVRERKCSDKEASALLLNILLKHLFKID